MSTTKFEEKMIKLFDQGKTRKASNLIEKWLDEGNSSANLSFLKLIMNPTGDTVAHKLTRRGFSFESIEILCLTGENRSRENILGHSGFSVAFILAKQGFFFEDESILKLGSERGVITVAHVCASKGQIFTNKEILNLVDDKGNSVAHNMASRGHQFQDESILNLKNDYGFTVADFQKQ